MEQIYESELWDPKHRFVVDGQVIGHNGKPVHFRSLLKRRWGWPKKAAYRAADFLMDKHGSIESMKYGNSMDGKLVLWLEKRGREEQQEYLFTNLTGLSLDLCSGLAGGAQREIWDAGHDLTSITVKLSEPIPDEGLSQGILHALATRLGTSIPAIRENTLFGTQTPDILIKTDVSPFDP